MTQLPPTLSRELVELLYRGKVDAVPGLRGFPHEVVAELCLAMKPLKSLRGDVIYRRHPDIQYEKPVVLR